MPFSNPVQEVTAKAFEHLAASGHIDRNNNQLQYADLIANHIGRVDPGIDQTGAVLPIQASTGIGKSLGYLIPLVANAALTGERAMVATHSLALMRQLAEEDLPTAIDAVQAVTSARRPTFQRRLGRRNIFDERRLAIVASRLHGAARDAMEDIAEWLRQDGCHGLIAEAAESYGLFLPDGVDVSDVCLLPGARSRHFDEHRDASRDADIVITSHTLAVIDATLWRSVIDGDRNRAVAVFDEADKLIDTARSLAETRIPMEALDAAASLCGRNAAALAKAAALALGNKDAVVVDPSRVSLIEAADAMASTTQVSGDDDAASTIAVLREWLDGARNSDSRVVAAVERTASGLALRVVTLDPARVLGRLWRQGKDEKPYMRAAVMTSATLAAPSEEDRHFLPFLRAIGADPQWTTVEAGETFEPRGHAFGALSYVVADRASPAPLVDDGLGNRLTNPDWLDYAAAGIAEARRRGGRTLVLATSYDDAEALDARAPGAIVHHRGQSLTDAIEAFIADPAGALITPAAWEGVSLPPGTITHLVVPRIPFAPPDAARIAALARWFACRGLPPKHAENVLNVEARAAGMRKLTQGMGRAIRNRHDTATIWLLDPRFPLPEELIRSRFGINQGQAKSFRDFVRCIPRRFREGFQPAFNKAEIFPVPPGNSAA